ncbi:MAG: PLDc N-terminal domain-containing protein [Lachnospiraceae bacterium]|nr:PLDc N-terminal domain-containing protein [Lachnospiraceae bacterium]
MNDLATLKEFLPFIIPLVIVQFTLLGYTIYHILTHDHYKRGNRILWMIVAIVGMEFVGPILYFILGKEEA